MTPLDYVRYTFAALYLAHVLTSTAGPYAVFAWLRDTLPHGRSSKPYITKDGSHIERHGVLDCALCLIFWVALFLVLAPDGWLVDVLAIAGAGVSVRAFTGIR